MIIIYLYFFYNIIYFSILLLLYFIIYFITLFNYLCNLKIIYIKQITIIIYFGCIKKNMF